MRTLLVVTTGNLEHVTAELITERIAGNLIEIPISQSFSIVVCVYMFFIDWIVGQSGKDDG